MATLAKLYNLGDLTDLFTKLNLRARALTENSEFSGKIQKINKSKKTEKYALYFPGKFQKSTNPLKRQKVKREID